MRAANGLVVIWLCWTGLLATYSNADVVRSKRDDVDPIKVTTIKEEPYIFVKNGEFTGFIPDMMEKIKDKIKISYKFKLVDDEKYGQKGSNNKWNGMIGEIDEDEADMAAAPMTISTEREQVVDFTEPFMTFDLTVLMKKNEDGSDPKIKSIRDLADQDKIKYGLVKDGRTEQIFEDTDDDKYKKMWEKISRNEGHRLGSIEDGVTKVRKSNGTFGFIMESISAEYWVLKKPCELTMTDEESGGKKSSYAFAMKRDWDRKDDFNKAITELKKEGEIAKLKKKWWTGACGGSSAMGISSSLPFHLLAMVSAILLRQL